MILQHLTSEVLKLPDSALEVEQFERVVEGILDPSTADDLIVLSNALFHKFQYEQQLQARVNLGSIETNMIKSKHFVSASELEDDFV